ncbi:MAG: hypothetical protein ABR534_07315 [Desulfotignum sp.]
MIPSDDIITQDDDSVVNLDVSFIHPMEGHYMAQDQGDSPDPGQDHTRQIIVLLQEQNTKLSADLRRVHREIAALRADLAKPGVKDVFAGIGYIFGLCGVAAFVAARRKE